jgi:hypothetical protein
MVRRPHLNEQRIEPLPPSFAMDGDSCYRTGTKETASYSLLGHFTHTPVPDACCQFVYVFGVASFTAETASANRLLTVSKSNSAQRHFQPVDRNILTSAPLSRGPIKYGWKYMLRYSGSQRLLHLTESPTASAVHLLHPHPSLWLWMEYCK